MPLSSTAYLSVAAWKYIDLAAPPSAPEMPQEETPAVPPIERKTFTEDELAAHVQSALAEAQKRWQVQANDEQARRDHVVSAALERFAQQRRTYFKQLEAEVVQLSLAIAKKILQREAELDPTLLAGLVRIALDRLGVESPVTVRVSPEAKLSWERALHLRDLENRFDLVGDSRLSAEDCLVETESGSAQFGFSAQLKDLEQSFSDLLARRPELS